MKKLIFPILILWVVFSFEVLAQKKKTLENISIPEMAIDDNTKYIIYKEVVQQEGSSTILYDKALAWAWNFYKSPTNVLREKNKEAGKLVARHRFVTYDLDVKTGVKNRAGVIEYTLTFLFKDGRYKYEITKVNIKSASYQGIEKWYLDSQKEYDHKTAGYLVQIDTELKKIISSFKKSIGKKEKVEEDW